jgi:hypothetical protein
MRQETHPMTQQKRDVKRRQSLPYYDVFSPGALLWFSECPEGYFRVAPVPTSERQSGGKDGKIRKP